MSDYIYTKFELIVTLKLRIFVQHFIVENLRIPTSRAFEIHFVPSKRTLINKTLSLRYFRLT